MWTAILHRAVWPPLKFLFWCFADLEVFGLEHVRRVPAPAIFVSNHQGPFDPFLIGMALPWSSPFHAIRWLARDDEFKKPVQGKFMRLLGGFPGRIKVGIEQAVEKPLRLLGRRVSVGVFPEWCYEGDVVALELIQHVVPLLAEKTRRPVIPVFLFGIERVTWTRLFLKRLHIHVAFGPAYYPGNPGTAEKIYHDVNTLLLRTRFGHLQDAIHQEEKRFWEEYGAFYRHLERAGAYRELIRYFESMLPERISGNWVDLGSGSGGIVELLIERGGNGGNIVASDHSPVMLRQLRERFPSRVAVREIDLVGKLPFADASVDGVTANLVLPYVVHHQGVFGASALEKLLGEIRRVLKPGGVFVWSTPKKNVRFFFAFFKSLPSMLREDRLENLAHGARIFRQALRIEEKGRRGIYHFLNREELFATLERAGFKGIQFDRSMAGQVEVIRCNA